MAKENPATPEKDLLKLIEDPGSEKKTPGAAAAIKKKGLSFFSFSAWLGRLSFFRKKFKTSRIKKQGLYLIDIRSLNKVLIFLIVILAVYFAVDLFFSIENFKKMPESEFKLPQLVQSQAVEDVSFLKQKPSYYVELVGRRNIFKLGRDPVKGVSKKVISVKLSELSKSLRLVGVSWSDNPDVMIEDKRAMRTFFVKRGEMVGELRVEAIYKDRVILSYAGEELELK